MAKGKKFFWLKLKDDFFNQREIKKLRKIAGGDTFTIIYLKMQLLSMRDEGILKFEGTEETLSEQLALELDEDEENVKLTLAFLHGNNLIEQISESEFLMPKTARNLGSEVDSAERVRKFREKKALQCNGDVTKSNTEIEIEIEKDIELEIDIDIERESERENDAPKVLASPPPKTKKSKPKEPKTKYGEYDNVLLTDSEVEKLIKEIPAYGVIIERLSEYIASTGKKYASHYATIRAWHRRDGEQAKPKEKERGSAVDEFIKIMEEKQRNGNESGGFY